MTIAVQRAGKLITVGADGRPSLAVEVDVGGELAADGRAALVDRIGKPRQLRGGIDQVDTALVLRGRGLGRAVPARTGIGQCYRDGVVFGSGKAAADRDIVRLGDGIGIGLAEVDDVCAVLVCCDRAAHGVGQRNRRIRRISYKLHLVRRQGSEGHILGHVPAFNLDGSCLSLIAVLADGIGVGTRGNGVCAVFAGDLRAATVLQHHRCTVGSFKGEGIERNCCKILQGCVIVTGITIITNGQHITLRKLH